MERVDIRLDRRKRCIRERFVGIAIDLAVARVNERPFEAGHDVGDALVDMDGDHANGADLGRPGDVKAVRDAGDGEGGRKCTFVRDSPERLLRGFAQGHETIDQIEETADFAAGRVDLQQHGPRGWIRQRGFHGGSDLAIVAGAEKTGQPVAAHHQWPDDRHHGDADLGNGMGPWRRIASRKHGRTGVEHWAGGEQAVERPRGDCQGPAAEPGEQRIGLRHGNLSRRRRSPGCRLVRPLAHRSAAPGRRRR